MIIMMIMIVDHRTMIRDTMDHSITFPQAITEKSNTYKKNRFFEN